MPRVRRLRPYRPAAALALFALAALALAAPARAEGPVDRFVGSFVGSGKAEVAGTPGEEIRDLDVTVAPFRDGGFTIKWITVVRDREGERTGEDVRRREVEESFVPAEDREGVFVPVPKGGLFQKAGTPDPIAGDPLRWAAIEGSAMTVYSIALGPAGGAELQVYRRTLTEKGMDVSFLRLMDERVAVRMTGELVRTK